MRYHLPYSGKFTFNPKVPMPANNFVVQLPKSMTFTAGAGSVFRSVPQNAAVQTLLLKNALPGKALEFSVSGSGSLPREEQGGQQQGADNGGQSQEMGGPSAQPGGGIGPPVKGPAHYRQVLYGGFWAGWDYCWLLRRASFCANHRRQQGHSSSDITMDTAWLVE